MRPKIHSLPLATLLSGECATLIDWLAGRYIHDLAVDFKHLGHFFFFIPPRQRHSPYAQVCGWGEQTHVKVKVPFSRRRTAWNGPPSKSTVSRFQNPFFQFQQIFVQDGETHKGLSQPLNNEDGVVDEMAEQEMPMNGTVKAQAFIASQHSGGIHHRNKVTIDGRRINTRWQMMKVVINRAYDTINSCRRKELYSSTVNGYTLHKTQHHKKLNNT